MLPKTHLPACLPAVGYSFMPYKGESRGFLRAWPTEKQLHLSHSLSTWHQEEKHSNVLLEFSSSSWLSLFFLFWFSILKSARWWLRYVLVCLVWFSPDSDGSESGWWTISIWQLVSWVHCPNLVLFYLFLVFLHPKSSIGLKPRVRFFECVFLYTSSLKPE